MATDLEGVEPVPLEELERIRLGALRKRIAERVVVVEIGWVETATPLACLVQIGMIQFWVPKSQIVGDAGPTWAVTRWIAEEKGLPHRELTDFELDGLTQQYAHRNDDIPF